MEEVFNIYLYQLSNSKFENSKSNTEWKKEDKRKRKKKSKNGKCKRC